MRNLNLMIEVTTDSLKSLNNKFGSLRSPPDLYLKVMMFLFLESEGVAGALKLRAWFN